MVLEFALYYIILHYIILFILFLVEVVSVFSHDCCIAYIEFYIRSTIITIQLDLLMMMTASVLR